MVTAKLDPRALRESPLQHLTTQLAEAQIANAVAIQELPFATMIGIRAMPGTAAHDALAAQLAHGLPSSVGEVAGQPDELGVLWISPDEFLAVSVTERPELLATLETALDQHRGHVVELSANRTIVELTGPAAQRVLRKITPTDVHDSVFSINRAITTTLARTPVLLWRTAQHTWRILPRASFAEHIAFVVMDAMQEFQHAPLE